MFSLEEGRHELTLEEGPDPTMSLVLLSDQGKDETALNTGAESCVRLYAEQEQPMNPGATVPVSKHVSLQLQSEGTKSFFIDVEKKRDIGLFTQHTAEEFNMKLTKVNNAPTDEINNDQNISVIYPIAERTWVAEHEHDDEVGSFAIERVGDVDPEKLNRWLSRLLSEKGVDIFRTKGFISYAGESKRIVFQGVHMLFTAQPDKEWGSEPRRNQLVFIGRNLDEKEMIREFDKCLV